MAQNVTIAGASYQNVPHIEVPKTGGGIALFYDVSGSQAITANGTYDVTTKESVSVNVPSTHSLQNKTVTANGSYTADSGYDGLGTVTVNVPGGGSWPPSTVTAGDTPVVYVAGVVQKDATFGEASRIAITRAGTYRFKWNGIRTSNTGTFNSQLYKNGTAVSEAYIPPSTDWVGAYSIDLSCNAGDVVAVYGRGRSSSYHMLISGFCACINGDNGF